MVSKREEEEVNMIPYYAILLLILLGVVVSILWSVCKERRGRQRDQERSRMAGAQFGGDIELDNLANNRPRPSFPFAWIRAIIASGEELHPGGGDDDDGSTTDNHVAAPRGAQTSRQAHTRTVGSREEFTTHRQAEAQQGFGSLESDPAGAGLFGGGPCPSPALDGDSKLDSVFLTPMDYDANSAQIQSHTLPGLTYTAQATLSNPFTREIKVHTVQLPTPALFPCLDTSPDDLIDQRWSKPSEYDKAAYPLENLKTSVNPSPMPKGSGDPQNGPQPESKLPAHSVLSNTDDDNIPPTKSESHPSESAAAEREHHEFSSQDLQSNDAWYRDVSPEEEWILYGLAGKGGVLL